MNLQPHQLYHIYNQGNNRGAIFFSRDHYLFFLKKVRKYIAPHCHILAYCLMPNHYHFLIETTDASVEMVEQGSVTMTRLAHGYGLLQSSYARAINLQRGRSGSIFRQKTRAKCLTHPAKPDYTGEYPLTCFHYIHQNPWKAGLVKRMEDWKFSSFSDYAGFRIGNLCHQALAQTLIDIENSCFYEESYQSLDPNMISRIF
jgi:putative transposase